MTEQQIAQMIAKHEERLATHERRITKNEDVTEQIHKLTSCVESLTNEVRKQNERIERNLDSHGERIGELEKKGSKKLDNIVSTIVTVAITAVLMYFLGNLGI